MIYGCPSLFACCTSYRNLYKQTRSQGCNVLRQDLRPQNRVHPSPHGQSHPRWGRRNAPIHVSEALPPLVSPRYLWRVFHWRQVLHSAKHSVVSPSILRLLPLFLSWRTGLQVSLVGGVVSDLTCSCRSRTAVLPLLQTQAFSVSRCGFLRRKHVRGICKLDTHIKRHNNREFISVYFKTPPTRKLIIFALKTYLKCFPLTYSRSYLQTLGNASLFLKH